MVATYEVMGVFEVYVWGRMGGALVLGSFGELAAAAVEPFAGQPHALREPAATAGSAP
jgi:hypothetical protein